MGEKTTFVSDDTRESLVRELEARVRWSHSREQAESFVDRCIKLGMAKAVDELTTTRAMPCRHCVVAMGGYCYGR